MSLHGFKARVRDRLQAGINQSLWLLSRRHVVHGLPVGVPWTDPERSAAATKLRAALDLIATAQPRRLARMKRDLSRLLVTSVQVADAQFDPQTRTCLLDQSYVCKPEISPAHLAAVIAHEATHARIFAAGIGYSPELRPRIERLCMRQELALALLLPDGELAAQHARRGLDLPDATWDTAAIVTRRIAVVRSWGWPEWLVRLIERGARRSAA